MLILVITLIALFGGRRNLRGFDGKSVGESNCIYMS
jgi:hypothetical protein